MDINNLQAGEKLHHKDNVSQIKTISSIENGMVRFTDNGSVELSKIGSIFEKHESAPQTNVRESVVNNAVQPNQQAAYPQTQTPPMDLNSMSSANAIMQAFDKAIENKNNGVTTSANDIPLENDAGNMIVENNGVSPETLAHFNNTFNNQPSTQQNIPSLEDQFNSDGSMKENYNVQENVKKVYSEDLGQPTGSFNSTVDSHQQQPHQPHTQPNQGYANNTTQPTQISSKLPKMKKTKKVNIKLSFQEQIPKLEDIRAVMSVFDDMDIIEEISKEIAHKFLSDPEAFQGMIYSEIEKMVKPRRKAAAKKPVARKTTTRKPKK